MWFTTEDTQKNPEKKSDRDNKLNKKKCMPQYGDSQVSINGSSDYNVNKRSNKSREGICLNMR